MFANQAILFSLIFISPLRVTKEIDLCARLAFVGFLISSLFAYILGGVWRFGEAGKFASGHGLDEGAQAGAPYQISNAKFLSIYYLISWILMGVYFIVACVGQNFFVVMPK